MQHNVKQWHCCIECEDVAVNESCLLWLDAMNPFVGCGGLEKMNITTFLLAYNAKLFLTYCSAFSLDCACVIDDRRR